MKNKSKFEEWYCKECNGNNIGIIDIDSLFCKDCIGDDTKINSRNKYNIYTHKQKKKCRICNEPGCEIIFKNRITKKKYYFRDCQIHLLADLPYDLKVEIFETSEYDHK